MEVDHNEWKTITRALEVWQQEGKITPEKATELKQTYSLKKPAQQIAQYFFLIALSCTLLAISAIFIDDRLLEKLKIEFALSNVIIALIMAAIAIVWFYNIKRNNKNLKTIAYEIYMVLGSFAVLSSLVYLCKDIGFGKSYSGFLAAATIILFVLSIFFRSTALWIGGILSLMGWYGTVTYVHSSDHLFAGMNYPVRFTLFGLILLGFSWLQKKITLLTETQRITYIIALLILFTALWGVSVFGNYNHIDEWIQVRQAQVLIYSFIFAAAAFLALWRGIKYKDDTTRDFGILFLLVNLYSRYFEYFWDNMNKGIFFLVLAISFWLLGRWIEKKRKNTIQL